MFNTIITPRFGDVDGLRHINNVSLIEWYETARNEFFQIFNPELSLDAWNLIMVHMEVDYLGQMYFGKPVEIKSCIIKIGNSSLTLRQEAWQGGELCARGDFVMIHFDFKSQKPVALTQEQRGKLQEHFVEV